MDKDSDMKSMLSDYTDNPRSNNLKVQNVTLDSSMISREVSGLLGKSEILTEPGMNDHSFITSPTSKRGVHKRDALTQTTIAAYAVGHLCNDLTVGLCYLYSLYYYQEVLGLDPIVGGLSVIAA